MSRQRATRALPRTARAVAATVVARVVKDRAYAAACLDAELERAAQLDDRDKRFATELVYGVLRCTGFLENRAARLTPRGLKSLDPTTRAHILVAAYQLLILERVPSFAAVSEAVQLILMSRGERLANFANAVLRKLSEEVRSSGPVALCDAILGSVSPWLVDQIAAALGSPEQAHAFLTAGPWPPPTCIRLRKGQDRESWCRRLLQDAPRAHIEKGTISPWCVMLSGAGPVSKLPGHGTAWVVQEQGAQVVGLLTDVRPGHHVLDACAGRGNKTLLLAELAGASGRVDAADRHRAKLSVLEQCVHEAGEVVGRTFAVDWSTGTGNVPDDYDRVLVDAPCSGTGTIRRRPELLQRNFEHEIGELRQLQTEILVRAASRCRPGGKIVYAVCSVLKQEAEDVVSRACQQCPQLKPVPFDVAGLPVPVAESCDLRLVPHRHGTDGYYVASLAREH